MAGQAKGALEAALGFEELALDHLRDGVPGLAFRERVAELPTELEQLLVMTAVGPTKTARALGRSRRFCHLWRRL